MNTLLHLPEFSRPRPDAVRKVVVLVSDTSPIRGSHVTLRSAPVPPGGVWRYLGEQISLSTADGRALPVSPLPFQEGSVELRLPDKTRLDAAIWKRCRWPSPYPDPIPAGACFELDIGWPYAPPGPWLAMAAVHVEVDHAPS